MRLAFLLANAVPLASCAPDTAAGIDARWAVEREERGDTVVVRTLGGSVWGDTMVLVAELTIGELEGCDAYMFGALRGIELDPAGRILVVDGQAREVRIFSQAGEHLLSFGRTGDGPGEFRRPDYVRVTRDGRIVVRDQPARFSIFSGDGIYLGGWPLNAGFSTSAPFFLDPDDRVLNPTTSDRLVWYDLDGTSLDTISPPSRGYAAPMLEIATGGGRARYSIPFTPGEVWTFTRDGTFLFGMNDEYAFERWEPDGGVLRVERQVDPVPVAPGEAARSREGLTRNIRGVTDAEWRWQGPDIPSTKPPYRFFLPGTDGTVWVLRSTAATEVENPEWDPERPEVGFPTYWQAPLVADVFDADGRYLGPVKLPPTATLFPSPVLTRERVWAITMHEMGYPQVRRFRLEPQGRL